jgi:PhnB protein
MSTTITPERPASKSTPASSSAHIEPYLFFDGRCEEALTYYRKALDAEVLMLMRFKDSPEPGMCGPVGAEKIMHASFRVGGSTILASDGRCEGKISFQGFALSITVPDEPTANRYFSALSDGGQVQQPLITTFFARRFGMVIDRFGVGWMVILPV